MTFVIFHARTSLVGVQFPMLYNECVRVVFFQSFNQLSKGFLLLWRASVCRKLPFIETSLVTDADGIAVVSHGVCPHRVTLRGAYGTTMYRNQVDAAVVLVLAAG